ncbi:MAG: prepilin-type N-terminal cleavage/methylation domain-containing protein [Erysipelotrichaceae bacterium]|nr:prepilin-type N-terminal cleavage/methylation domain-containing protein [Erysipelotrichaceae bacterium]
MNRHWNKKGFTLIEMVVVLAVLGLVLAGLTTVVGFAAGFFKDEDSSIMRQENVRYVTVNFEKDLRTSDQSVTKVNGCVYIDTIAYCLVDNKVLRNDIVIASYIESFDVTIDGSGSYLDLVVASTPDGRDQTVSAETRLYLRKGD